MTAFNVVKYQVKPDMEEKFMQVHREATWPMEGFKRGSLIKTGDCAYCFLGEWDNAQLAAQAEAPMVEILNQFMDTLEEQVSGQKTDAAFGDVLIEY